MKKILVAIGFLFAVVCGCLFFAREDTTFYSFDEVCTGLHFDPPCTPDKSFQFGMVGEPTPEELRNFDAMYGPKILAVESLMENHQYQRAKTRAMPDGGVVMEYWGGCLMYRVMGYWDGTYIWFPNDKGEWSAYIASEGFAEELKDVLKTYGNIIL